MSIQLLSHSLGSIYYNVKTYYRVPLARKTIERQRRSTILSLHLQEERLTIKKKLRHCSSLLYSTRSHRMQKSTIPNAIPAG